MEFKDLAAPLRAAQIYALVVFVLGSGLWAVLFG
jgi:hypothetical protein